MKKTCNRCKALLITSYSSCELGYKNEPCGNGKYMPLEYCPKPTTYDAMKCLALSNTSTKN